MTRAQSGWLLALVSLAIMTIGSGACTAPELHPQPIKHRAMVIGWQPVSRERAADLCGQALHTRQAVNGCAQWTGGACRIIAPSPLDAWDQGALETLGHEFYHCFTGNFHD